MKTSELPKNSRISLRINSKVRKLLKKKKISNQEMFDKALDRKIKVTKETEIKLA